MTASWRYLPETGVLSGASFESQTVEFLTALDQKAGALAARITRTENAVAGVVSTGSAAATTARQASDMALAAREGVRDALSKIDAAQKAAQEGVSTANEARSAATAIAAEVAAAVSRAGAAEKKADAAAAKAASAQEAATGANESLEALETAALQANTAAGVAGKKAEAADEKARNAMARAEEALEAPAWLPLYFEGNSRDPLRSMMPPDRTRASIAALDCEGSTAGLTLSAKLGFGQTQVTIPVFPSTVDVSALRGKCVEFTLSGLADTAAGAGVLLRLGV